MDDSNEQPTLNFKQMTFSEIAELPYREEVSMDSGWFPLHILCHQNLNAQNSVHGHHNYLELFDKVLASCPRSASLETKEGWLPLHIICRNSVDNEIAIQKLLKANNKAAKVPTALDGWYPLHQVCRYSQSLEVIKMVYDAFPKAVGKKSLKGKYPNQLLENNPAYDDLNFYHDVIRACPQLAVHQMLNRAAVPLVHAVEMSEEESRALDQLEESQRYVIPARAFTEIASTPIDGGMYLLHALCQQGAPAGEIKDALGSYPQAAMKPTDDGWLPLHLACRNCDEYQSILMVLEAYPEAARFATPEGWYPLHQLCRYSCSLEAIKLMYEAYPPASNALSSKGSSPLHMLLNYHPLAAQCGRSVMNCDKEYKNDQPVVSPANIHSTWAGDTAVASAVDHSPSMGVIKFEDVCILLDTRRK
jgi:ankyrin repeat protein